jgi:integration host factor subunit beta
MPSVSEHIDRPSFLTQPIDYANLTTNYALLSTHQNQDRARPDWVTLEGVGVGTTTKKELALRVSQDTGCKKNLASDMVGMVFETMRESLVKAQRIEIRGFGVFQVKETRPKPTARNPRTGQVIYVPTRRKTHFRPGKLLKEELHRPKPLPGADDSTENERPTYGSSPSYQMSDRGSREQG